jgi:hypothetical protein
MAARAQDSPADLQQRRQDVADALAELKARMVDLAVPDSPAFTVLGLTPEEIAPPTTGRALAASLLNGVDRRGVLQSGVAVDTLPYLALAGHLLTLDGYRGRLIAAHTMEYIEDKLLYGIQGWEKGFDVHREFYAHLRQSKDYDEGSAAFGQRRKPEFTQEYYDGKTKPPGVP